ncbi:choice-of-anchor L domain-containing protein [Bernardetia sp. OM2101]|uniref:choice-of-anchor L domain-containing protein n=1 Tax=Bernardetia sp. OM2101 TaxID=3344876 RepID=UPI0035D0495E
MTQKVYLLVLFIFLSARPLYAQIPMSWDLKLDTIEVEKYNIKWEKNKIYLRTNYGGYKIVNAASTNQIKNNIISKVEMIYTDFPKGKDLTLLTKKRLAHLYLLMPELFDKPWIEWVFVKQTGINNISAAHSHFHGFVIHLKSGSPPNAIVQLPKEVIKKLEKIKVKVEAGNKNTLDTRIKNILEGKNVKISNLKMNNKASMVYNHMDFEEKKNTIEIIEGVVMTTGHAENAIGPNNSPSITHVWSNDTTADKDLMKSAGKDALLFDPCIMEFDIEINADTLIVEYVFASEEYPEFLDYHDIFGIYISQEGSKNAKNIAFVPNSTLPVSVGNINHITNNDYYIANSWDKDLYLFKAWQYDGFSTLLEAKILLERGKKYHIKIAIADFGDPFFDSAVFLKAKGVKAR